MCISLAKQQATAPSKVADGSEPFFIPIPQTFAEGFSPSQSKTRGTTNWATLFSTSQLAAGIASIPPGGAGTLSLHRHVQPELYHMLSGACVLEIEGKQFNVEKGMTIYIPGDAEHGVTKDLSEEGDVCRWLYVFPSRFEDVEYRFRSEGAYGDIAVQDGSGKVMKAKL